MPEQSPLSPQQRFELMEAQLNRVSGILVETAEQGQRNALQIEQSNARMDESNARMDRVERTLEQTNARIDRFVAEVHEAHDIFESDLQQLLTAQIVLNDQIQKIGVRVENLAVQQAETAGKLDALIHVVDEWIRNQPRRNGHSEAGS